MSTVACPRHGIVDVPKDTPCPACGVPAYDLDDRNARDVVRQTRAFALKRRVMLCGAAVFLVVAIGMTAARIDDEGITVDFLAFFVATLAAMAAARPLAQKLERNPALRALDRALAERKI